MKEESEKAALKLNIQKKKQKTKKNSTFKKLRSGQIAGETMKTVTDFIFLGSKITTNGDCSLEIKRCLLL